MKTVKITTNGQALPSDVSKLIDVIKSLPKKEAKTIIQKEIDFFVCDLRIYHGNYNNNSAWIGGKSNESFTVNFEY